MFLSYCFNSSFTSAKDNFLPAVTIFSSLVRVPSKSSASTRIFDLAMIFIPRSQAGASRRIFYYLPIYFTMLSLFCKAGNLFPAQRQAKKPPGEQNRTAEKEENAVLQDVDVFPGQRLVHAADGAELAAHGAGVAVVILRQAGIPDGFGGLGVQGAGELGIPVQHAAGIAHLVVDIPGMGDALGDIGRMGGDLGGHDALLHIVHVGQSQMLGGGNIPAKIPAAWKAFTKEQIKTEALPTPIRKLLLEVL